MSVLGTIRKQLSSHPALIPLFIFVGAGCTMAGAYLGRVLMYCPDIIIDRKNNPEPWNKISPTYQYRLYSPILDHSKLKKEYPDY